ncbi:hypothetical protein I3842_Q017000 [Carya illinoinensis]|uniref:Uncharacterized protein n=1 Tax=Carya illinoinensis TaxID=32201 RepID=A0A922D3F9_CARIL|nr:hypothetical protein I3842_Q017000 [Carya illinoinensis]
MSDQHQDPKPPQNLPSSSSSSNKIPGNGTDFSGHKARYPNPPDASNPDPATLREQWRFAIKQYSRWYSSAWGTAILAGISFFALGWIIKGSNPLPSFRDKHPEPSSSSASSSTDDASEARHEVGASAIRKIATQSIGLRTEPSTDFGVHCLESIITFLF